MSEGSDAVLNAFLVRVDVGAEVVDELGHQLQRFHRQVGFGVVQHAAEVVDRVVGVETVDVFEVEEVVVVGVVVFGV